MVAEASRRGHSQWGFSLDEEMALPELTAQLAFRYSWPESSLRRRLDFHRHHEPLAASLRAWIAQVQPELIHIQNLTAFRSTVFPVLGSQAAPVLMTAHDFSLADPNPAGLSRVGWTGRLKSLLDRASLARSRREAFRAVDRFLCPTEALRWGVGFPEPRSRLQRLPIELAEIAPWRPLLNNNPLQLFFAGSLYRSKGVDLLLQALPLLRGAARGAALEIAGSGDQQAALEQLCKDLGLSERVRFLGHCGASAMEEAYSRCHLLVLPSRVPENSPLTVLEAGARGRASLASGRGGSPELLAEDRGWTFRNEDVQDLAQGIERAVADPQELQARGLRMRAWVRQEFQPQRHWDDLEAHRQDLVTRGRAR